MKSKIRRDLISVGKRLECGKCLINVGWGVIGGNLEPDLIILDEFQRFKDLLGNESDAGELAQELMNYPDVRVLFAVGDTL